MKKFQNKYRIPSARANWWNYSNVAWYFITICTKNREEYFGSISNGKMCLSETGDLADKYWFEIPMHFPFVKLHAFVVMPNHVHGIIEILDNVTLLHTVETLHATSLPQKNEFMANISPKRGSLASIIRSYKSAVTKDARIIHADFGWQERFHDHIIRDDTDYLRICNYIDENPMNWDKDKNNNNP